MSSALASAACASVGRLDSMMEADSGRGSAVAAEGSSGMGRGGEGGADILAVGVVGVAGGWMDGRMWGRGG
jgi:hypothetical protein